jgi:stress-induced-phosphoprotein 1
MELHNLGNNCFLNGEYDQAIKYYSTIIKDNNYDKMHIIYSNKSACYLKLNNYIAALNDGLNSIQCCLNYAIAWGRVGSAYKGLKIYENSLQSYKIANNLNPENENYIKEIQNYIKKVDLTPYSLFKIFLNNGNLMERLKNKHFKNMLMNTKNPMDLINNVELHNIMLEIIDNLKMK